MHPLKHGAVVAALAASVVACGSTSDAPPSGSASTQAQEPSSEGPTPMIPSCDSPRNAGAPVPNEAVDAIPAHTEIMRYELEGREVDRAAFVAVFDRIRGFTYESGEAWAGPDGEGGGQAAEWTGTHCESGARYRLEEVAAGGAQTYGLTRVDD